MSQFPACKHKKHRATGPRRDGLRWLASEPYRLFIFSGAVWSIIGVALWPLYYAQQIGFYPSFVHARIMSLRLANLLLYQGLLLPPVLGIGAFVFPRMLGGEFGEPKSAAQSRTKLIRAVMAAALLISSFFLEAFGQIIAGYAVRSLVAAAYLLLEVRWKREQTGSLTTGLLWSLILGWLGLVLAGFFYAQHVSVEHLLYIGGFGMLMLIVGSRVLFGHSGDLDGFFVRSKWVRFLIFLGVLAAITRATPAWVPSTTVSHHIYAALTWALLATLWLLWHRKRFVKRDEEE